jgi:hypothetical protein
MKVSLVLLLFLLLHCSCFNHFRFPLFIIAISLALVIPLHLGSKFFAEGYLEQLYCLI